jgi:UDP-N-acetylglucosamine--N-acetylmuramyl-(pentapeptide) pyrophosphoryl-undecaprenol N-acetylglucosamine transferase
VRPFLTEMDLALGAATLAVSRAGASSLAEFAAMRLPPLLIPYPTAADNHQFYNAAAFADTGAARMIEQSRLTPESLAQQVVELFQDAEERERMQQALAQWYLPDAASRIARHILARIIGGASILDAPSEGEAASATHPSFSKIARSHPVEL